MQHHVFMQRNLIMLSKCICILPVSPGPLWPHLFVETICLLPSSFSRSLRSPLVGRLGWVQNPPHQRWFCLALLSSPLKLVSSHIVLTGWVSTRSRQYFARIRANGRSCNCFAHGHRQSRFHRIDRGTFRLGNSSTAAYSLLLSGTQPPAHAEHKSRPNDQRLLCSWSEVEMTNGSIRNHALSLRLMTGGLRFDLTHMHIFKVPRVYKHISENKVCLVFLLY